MKQLNIGIIGAGRIGKVHMKSITYNVPGAKVLGITDVFQDALPQYDLKIRDALQFSFWLRPARD